MEAPLRFSLETRRREVQLSESVAVIAAPSTNLDTASHVASESHTARVAPFRAYWN